MEAVRIGCSDGRGNPVRCADAPAPKTAVRPAPHSAPRPSPPPAARKAPAAAPLPSPAPKGLGPEEIGELIKRARDEALVRKAVREMNAFWTGRLDVLRRINNIAVGPDFPGLPAAKPAPARTQAFLGLEYHGPDARKPTDAEMIAGALRVILGVYAARFYDRAFRKDPLPAERKKLLAVGEALKSSSAGAALINAFGGWAEVEALVELRFGATPSANSLAIAVPNRGLLGWGARKKHLVVLARESADLPPQVLASTLGHELKHVLDRENGHEEEDLAITGEQAAHRVQVRIHLELEKTLAPETKEKLKKDRRYDYLSFVTELWVDRLMTRYASHENFAAAFTKDVQKHMARIAYDELVSGEAKPGSRHLDRHVEDFYRTVTEEKFVDIEIEKRRNAPDYSNEDKVRDERLLKEAAEIVAEADKEDHEFRNRAGYRIPGDQP